MMQEEKSKMEKGSQFWWPDVSKPDRAMASAKGTQFIAYWIGGSYLVMAYLSSENSNYVLGAICILLGIGIWRNLLWIVPVVSSLGVLEAGFKLVSVLSIGRVNGLIIAGMMLILSIHGWRGWLALRKQAKHRNPD